MITAIDYDGFGNPKRTRDYEAVSEARLASKGRAMVTKGTELQYFIRMTERRPLTQISRESFLRWRAGAQRMGERWAEGRFLDYRGHRRLKDAN